MWATVHFLPRKDDLGCLFWFVWAFLTKGAHGVELATSTHCLPCANSHIFSCTKPNVFHQAQVFRQLVWLSVDLDGF